jgi:hypothetical protein
VKTLKGSDATRKTWIVGIMRSGEKTLPYRCMEEGIMSIKQHMPSWCFGEQSCEDHQRPRGVHSLAHIAIPEAHVLLFLINYLF